jgi:hypothetical protein
MKKKNDQVIAAVTADLRNPSMGYMLIALKHKVGLSFVNQAAKSAGLRRQRGPSRNADTAKAGGQVDQSTVGGQ